MKKHSRTYPYYLLFLLLIAVQPGFGQLFNYTHYNVENGFPQSNANHIFQDNQGFLWFATQNGAVKFNGRSYEITDISNGLADNLVNHINQDKENNLWISTNAGLTKITDGKAVVYRKKDGLPSDKIQGTYVTDKNKILICTNKSACLYENNRFIPLDTTVKPEMFIQLKNKKILALTNQNIYYYENREYKAFDTDISLLKPPFAYITEAHDSSLWIAGKHGMYKLLYQSVIHYTTEDGLISNDINCILCDSENNIWYSSERNGSGVFADGTFQNFTADAGMANTSVLSLIEDSERNIWIGGRNGVTMINPKVPFIHYNMISPYENEIILGIEEDKEGNIWFCTYGFGLFKYDGSSFTNYTISSGSIDNHFFDLEFDENGTMWLASANNGILQFDGKTFKKSAVQNFETLKTRVLTMYKDSRDRIWFGTNGEGIFLYDGNTLKNFNPNKSLHELNVTAIDEDFEGNMWFGTYGKGLFMYNGKKVKDIGKAYGIDLGTIRAIEKTDDEMWFGTASEGIFKIKKKDDKYVTECIDKSTGLNSNNIYLLFYDSKGNLWCGTEKGADKIQFNSDNSIKSIKNYTVDEGFIGVETNINGYLEDSKGNIWFGTINGAVKYIEERDKINTVENNTYITDMKLFFEDTQIKDFEKYYYAEDSVTEIILPHDKNHLLFQFIGLCYSNPQKVLYKYRLKGQNDQWSPPVELNTAVFTDIAPGSYEFQVISANNDGKWNKEPASVPFIIEQPFWQKMWFKTALILLILILIYTIAELRNRSLKKAKIKLEKMVKERTGELHKQKDQLLQSNIKIKDGIYYAGKIQSAMLPANELFENSFSEHFIFYQPKDIISGDFYWAKELIHQNDPYVILAAADCTGHGIPGALISMLGMSILNEVIRKKEVQSADRVLEELRKEIKRSLHQRGEIEDQTEGIDMVITAINKKTRMLEYSGANNPLYIVRNKELHIIKPTINPVGIFIKELPFEKHNFQLEKDDIIYMFSDGYVDQFNGNTGEKFKIGRFRKLLLSNAQKPLQEQKQILEKTFIDWKADSEQIDDVLIIGLKIK